MENSTIKNSKRGRAKIQDVEVVIIDADGIEDSIIITESAEEDILQPLANRKKVRKVAARNEQVVQKLEGLIERKQSSFSSKVFGTKVLSLKDLKLKKKSGLKVKNFVKNHKINVKLGVNDIRSKALRLSDKTNIVFKYEKPRFLRKLLVLDIDKCIMDNSLDYKHSSPFSKFCRPYLHEFLELVSEQYDIVFWSQSTTESIEKKLELLRIIGKNRLAVYPVLFTLSMFSMPNTTNLNHKSADYNRALEIKPLCLIWNKFSAWNETNTIHVDDLRRNFLLNKANGLEVRKFNSDITTLKEDKELLYVARYLRFIATEDSDFSTCNHKKFRECKDESFPVKYLAKIQKFIGEGHSLK